MPNNRRAKLLIRREQYSLYAFRGTRSHRKVLVFVPDTNISDKELANAITFLHSLRTLVFPYAKLVTPRFMTVA